ncbi:MAG: TonB-dependent receptor [candidate division KSB1 bacterium]|nr:TonB-dependent receptor [candidate division KSB1 bacterium]
MKRKIAFLLFVFILLSPRFISGQTKGFIKGRIVDADNGEGLPAVNVMVQGTYYGAATDLDGNFIIRSMNPGVYTLQISMIGYTQVQQTGVKVTAGDTTRLEVKLKPTVLALGQEVVVIGEKPLFKIDDTATRKTITSAEIANAIVESVRDVVASQVGVVETDDEIHIRGGRSYENALLLDGVSVQDPLSGTGFGLRLSKEAIEEIEVITGGFNAEYGQAMSGIVNVITKEGGETYHGSLSYKRDHFGSFNPDVPIVGPLSSRSRFSFHTDVLGASLHGPEVLTSYFFPGQVSFFANVYMFLSDDYTKYAAQQLYSSTFGGTRFALRENNNWSWLGKLTWKIDPSHKLALAYNQSVGINQNTQSLQTNLEYVEPGPGYPYEFQKNLDNFNTFTHNNNQISLTWTHTLNPRTFYELRLSRYFAHLRSDVNGKHWSEYQEPQDIVTQPIEYYFSQDSSAIYVLPGDGFWDYGDGETWHDHYVEEWTLKADITNHRSHRHKLKAGIEATYREMQLIDIYRPWFGGLGLNNDIYRVYPNFGACYIQDNITFQGLIANLGVRFDYWFPGKYVEDAVNNPEVITISDETRRRFRADTYSLFGRRWKGRISPRIGISHPVSTTGRKISN